MSDKKREKTRYVQVNASSGSFVSKMIMGSQEHDFSDIKLLRNLLSNEKARILYTLKSAKPTSIYALAKLLKRDLASVRDDLQVLERFGLIDFYAEKKGSRESLMPVLTVDRMNIVVDI